MTLYAEGSLTTIKVNIIVLDLGSLPMVTHRMVVPRGEAESPVNPIRAEVIGARSLLVKLSFWKASKYRTLIELPMSTIILLTQALAILTKITRASSWLGCSASPIGKVISGPSYCRGCFSTIARM